MINSGRRHERREARHERRETLLARLLEAEQTLHALRDGEVDALVVRGDAGDRVYTLHGAEEPYRLLVEQMREGAVVLGVTGEILYANKRFAGFVGEPLEAVLGDDIGRFMPESERVDVAAFLRSGNGARRSQLVARCGTRLDVYLSLATTVSPTGVRNLSLIVTDITELVEARGERDRAEHDSHAKNEFLAMLAHELRNPLGAIRNAVAVLESLDPANGPSAQARGVIARQAGHLSSLVDDLLDVERVASGKIRLNRQPLDLAEAVRHAVASFIGDALLDRRVDVRTEPAWVEGDAVRLEQVLANIVANAIKYTPTGGEIHVSVRADAGEAVLSVQDSGFGITPELLPSIFDMFVQGDRTLDRAKGGLGIGLTLVRRLVELHGGTVVASSGGAGRGSTFTVRLPSVTEARKDTARFTSSLDHGTSRRVLLIEDSRDAREMLAMLLEGAGHSVYEAEDGQRALQLLETQNPEVAIIDIGLPGLDGYQLAKRIRQQPNGRAMLLLALTGYGAPADYERSIEAGFDHHLVKPVDPQELERIVSVGAAKGAAVHA